MASSVGAEVDFIEELRMRRWAREKLRPRRVPRRPLAPGDPRRDATARSGTRRSPDRLHLRTERRARHSAIQIPPRGHPCSGGGRFSTGTGAGQGTPAIQENRQRSGRGRRPVPAPGDSLFQRRRASAAWARSPLGPHLFQSLRRLDGVRRPKNTDRALERVGGAPQRGGVAATDRVADVREPAWTLVPIHLHQFLQQFPIPGQPVRAPRPPRIPSGQADPRPWDSVPPARPAPGPRGGRTTPPAGAAWRRSRPCRFRGSAPGRPSWRGRSWPRWACGRPSPSPTRGWRRWPRTRPSRASARPSAPGRTAAAGGPPPPPGRCSPSRPCGPTSPAGSPPASDSPGCPRPAGCAGAAGCARRGRSGRGRRSAPSGGVPAGWSTACCNSSDCLIGLVRKAATPASRLRARSWDPPAEDSMMSVTPANSGCRRISSARAMPSISGIM